MKSNSKIKIKRKFPRVRLMRLGNVLVASAPSAQKMSVEEINEWIRKSRDREI
jgi:hypothetical protein